MNNINTDSCLPIISVPSWVIAGTYAENLRFLEDKKEIDGVELLFFVYDSEVKDELDLQWDEIRRYINRFIFTAHLPELLLPVHGELISRLAPLVRHFIVHPEGNRDSLNRHSLSPVRRMHSPSENNSIQIRLLSEWTERYNVSFLMENTKAGNLEKLLPYIEHNIGLCMDTGHLLLEGQNPADFFVKYRERIKEIHLHGVDEEQSNIDGKLADHRRLWGNEPWLLELLPLLEDYEGVINLESFSWEEARASIDILPEKLVQKRNRQ